MTNNKNDKDSSQDEINNLKSELEKLKSQKEIEKLKTEIEAYKKQKSNSEMDINREDYLFNNPRFKKKSQFKVYALSLITFGIYGLYLQYKSIIALNRIHNKKILDPQLYIVLTIFTCTFAGIYYYWRLVKEFELIIKEQSDQVIDRNNLTQPPFKNLKEYFIGWIVFSFVCGIFSVGFSWIVDIVIDACFFMWFQITVDYALDLRKRAELIDS